MPPCPGIPGILRSATRPPAMRSSPTLVGRRASAAVRPLPTAISEVIGDAPSIRVRSSTWPPSSRMAMVTFQLFFFASASAAAVIRRQSSRVRQGLVFIGRDGNAACRCSGGGAFFQLDAEPHQPRDALLQVLLDLLALGDVADQHHGADGPTVEPASRRGGA